MSILKIALSTVGHLKYPGIAQTRLPRRSGHSPHATGTR